MNGLDLARNVEFRRAFSPLAVAQNDNTTFVSEIIDMQGFKSCTFLTLLGTLVDAAFTTVFLLEDGDDSGLSDNAPVADDQMHLTEAGAAFIQSDDDKVRVIGYHGIKRFCRLTITPSDNTGDLPLGMIAALAKAEIAPVDVNS